MSEPSQQPEQFPNAVMLTAKDMRASLAFYRDTLGFTLKECFPTEEDPKWANLLRDGQSVMLGAQFSIEEAQQALADDPGALEYMKALDQEFRSNRPGVGVVLYIMVKDVDDYHRELKERGLIEIPDPRDQFYGLRDFGLEDPDGYRLLFYSPIAMSSCQSCGMPLLEAEPGEMYCGLCVDEHGRLRSYGEVFEGTVAGFFMGMQKMGREEAEAAAKVHLAGMPAWKARG